MSLIGTRLFLSMWVLLSLHPCYAEDLEGGNFSLSLGGRNISATIYHITEQIYMLKVKGEQFVGVLENGNLQMMGVNDEKNSIELSVRAGNALEGVMRLDSETVSVAFTPSAARRNEVVETEIQSPVKSKSGSEAVVSPVIETLKAPITSPSIHCPQHAKNMLKTLMTQVIEVPFKWSEPCRFSSASRHGFIAGNQVPGLNSMRFTGTAHAYSTGHNVSSMKYRFALGNSLGAKEDRKKFWGTGADGSEKFRDFASKFHEFEKKYGKFAFIISQSSYTKSSVLYLLLESKGNCPNARRDPLVVSLTEKLTLNLNRNKTGFFYALFCDDNINDTYLTKKGAEGSVAFSYLWGVFQATVSAVEVQFP